MCFQKLAGACVILDNSPTHNSNKDIDAALEVVGARLISPLLSRLFPIEPFWSKAKDVLKSLGSRTYQAFEEAIDIAYEKMSLNNIR